MIASKSFNVYVTYCYLGRICYLEKPSNLIAVLNKHKQHLWDQLHPPPQQVILKQCVLTA